MKIMKIMKIMKPKNVKLFLIVTTMILGLLFVITNKPHVGREGFSSKCHDLLIEREGKLYLVNTKAMKVPGINPLIFDNLEEYLEYFEWHRAKGEKCPALFLQHTYTAQGNPEYVERPSPMDLQGGRPTIKTEPGSESSLLLDAYHTTNPPYNKNQYPGYDPENQYIGLTTPLDKMFNQDFDGVSPNPMDPNWAGSELTQALVDKGYYEANNVYKIKS